MLKPCYYEHYEMTLRSSLSLSTLMKTLKSFKICSEPNDYFLILNFKVLWIFWGICMFILDYYLNQHLFSSH